MAAPEGRVRLYNYRDITYEESLADEGNIIAQNQQYKDTIALKILLYENAAGLCQLVAAHLGLESAHVQIDIPQNWRQGSFNLVLPILIYDQAVEKPIARNPADYPDGLPFTDASVIRRVVLRWPIPGCCGETYYPGALLEKMCSEVASYIWMQRHCPEVRTPQLYGFGFPTGQHYTQASLLPLYRRVVLYIQQAITSFLHLPVPSKYGIFQPPSLPSSIVPGYMILEYLGPEFGEVITSAIRRPETPAQGDDTRRRNLYHSLSRIMLSIGRIPQLKIGAFRFDPTDNTIALANRPVTCDAVMLENEGVPRILQPGVLYTSAQAYVDKLLEFQKARFQALANSVSSREDCESQMSVWVVFRAVADYFRNLHRGEDEDSNNGPFRLCLTDFNAANFYIDKDWNITVMYDLEWIVALPLSMHEPPHWLTWKPLGQYAGKHFDEFSAARDGFMEVFRAEEKAQSQGCDSTPISNAMDASWASGRYWFNTSLLSVNGLHLITQYRLRQVFGLEEPVGREYWRLWAPNAEAVAQQKVRDRMAYVTNLAALFGRDP